MIPSIFVGHGAPTIIYDNNEYTNRLKNYFIENRKPKSILIISAHYENEEIILGASEEFSLIYDFYGFPRELYEETLQVKGDKSLAYKAQKLLMENPLTSALKINIDFNRGLDHGSWSILKLIDPEGTIPVVQMSINSNLPGKTQFDIGRSLAALKDEDVLIIGSGGMVHNLRVINFYSDINESISPWAADFHKYITEALNKYDIEKVVNYKEAPYGNMAVPTPDHYIPLIILMGTGYTNKNSEVSTSYFQFSNLSLDLIKFH